MIPLMTRRSSTLGLPRVSLGKCGLSRANCSSLSQKESRSINGLLSETLNHDAPRFGNQFMGPEPRPKPGIAAPASAITSYRLPLHLAPPAAEALQRDPVLCSILPLSQATQLPGFKMPAPK